MGRLIRNGEDYTSSSSDALSTDYKNNSSGLDATNVQDAIDELNNKKVNVTDIVDDLTSSDKNKPLSANMGKVLNDKLSIKTLSSSLVTMRSGYISNEISIIKSGNMLSLLIDFKGSTSSSIKTGENKIADIDTSIRPVISSSGGGRILHSSGEVNEASCVITSGGEIRFHCTNVGTAGLISATYIIK